jgi:hypothetical protein
MALVALRLAQMVNRHGPHEHSEIGDLRLSRSIVKDKCTYLDTWSVHLCKARKMAQHVHSMCFHDIRRVRHTNQ